MLLAKDPNAGDFIIHSYEPGKLVINEDTYTHSLIISPHRLIEWSPRNFAELSAQDLEQIIDLKPEIILLGTGKLQHMPSAQLLAPLINKHIGVESMSTLAACRTFAVLASEGRNVAAALLIT